MRYLKVQNRRLFHFKDCDVLLQFKKLDEGHMSSNYLTPFALDFNSQEELPGIPPSAPRLIAGYIPKQDWTAIRDVILMCPNGMRPSWSFSLTDSNSGQVIAPFLTPCNSAATTERHHAQPPPAKRVRVRGAPPEHDKDSDASRLA